MNIDNVYVANIKEATGTTLNRANGIILLSRSIKYTLVYAKKNKYKKYDYYDLITGEKYRKSNECLLVGDIYIDITSIIPYKQYLYDYNKNNELNIKIKNNMFKKKMLILFNDIKDNISK